MRGEKGDLQIYLNKKSSEMRSNRSLVGLIIGEWVPIALGKN